MLIKQKNVLAKGTKSLSTMEHWAAQMDLFIHMKLILENILVGSTL